jgi:hypothetical protein
MNRLTEWGQVSAARHSAISIRTRTSEEHSNCSVVKSSWMPQLISSTRHSSRLPDPIREHSKKLIDDRQEDYLLKLDMGKKFRKFKIFNENHTIDPSVINYINRKFSTPQDIDDPSCFEISLNKGTLGLMEGQENVILAQVNDDKSVQFSRAAETSGLKRLYSAANKDTPMPNELMMYHGSPFAAVRYNDHLNIFKMPKLQNGLRDDKIVEKCDTYSDELIIASCLSNKYLIIVNSKNILRNYDLECRLPNLTMKLEDYFFLDRIFPVSVQHNQKEHCITMTTKKKFCLIDCRANSSDQFNKIFSNEDHFALKCEVLLNHANSTVNPNLVYIATSHLLYLFDYRYLKEPIVHWTHNLIKPALMLKTDMYDSHEIVCVASHKAGDFRLFNRNSININYYPVPPVTIVDTFDRLRENGLFLLSNDIKERVNASTTGVALRTNPRDGNITVYSQNYFGDIFENVFQCGDDCEEPTGRMEKLINKFDQWKNHLAVTRDPNEDVLVQERLQNNDLVFCDISRCEGVGRILTGDKTPAPDVTQLEPENNPAPSTSWKISIEDARSYNDLLAKEIMQVWDDIDIQESHPDIFAKEIDATLAESQKGIEKVSLWLEKSVACTQSSLNDTIDFEDSTVLIDRLATFTVATATGTPLAASAKKKKPRVKGF